MSASTPGAKTEAVREHEAPYPSWTVIAGGITSDRDAAHQDSQALKEARIWQALADEVPADEVKLAARR